MEHITMRVIQDERAAKEAFTKMSTNNNARISTINVYLINIIFTHQCVCSRVSNVRYLPPANSFFILSIRAMAKSILGPVAMHICEPDSLSSLRKPGHQSDHEFGNINVCIFKHARTATGR